MMTGAPRRAWFIAFLLIATSALMAVLRPDAGIVTTRHSVDLAQLVPARFAGWRLDSGAAPEAVSAAAASRSPGTYTRILERIYIDGEQRRVMLSIAYGERQHGDAVQAHRPEYCYQAQGFSVGAASDGLLATSHGTLPVRRLMTHRAGRSEPVSYWLMVGDQATLPGLSRKIAQLRHGLSGTLPDGMLVRVSSIDDSAATAYAVHERFIADLISALPDNDRVRFAGRPAV
jgi:EpsI family protein